MHLAVIMLNLDFTQQPFIGGVFVGISKMYPWWRSQVISIINSGHGNSNENQVWTYDGLKKNVCIKYYVTLQSLSYFLIVN